MGRCWMEGGLGPSSTVERLLFTVLRSVLGVDVLSCLDKEKEEEEELDTVFFEAGGHGALGFPEGQQQ